MEKFIYYVLFSYMLVGIIIILWSIFIEKNHQKSTVKPNTILSLWSIGLGILMIGFTIKWGLIHNLSLWHFQPISIITIFILLILMMMFNIITIKK